MRTLRLGLLMAMCAVCAEQQGFPLKPGEWEATPQVPGKNLPPIRLCFNDASWIQAVFPNPKCKLDHVAVTATGATYDVSCSLETERMTGTGSVKFDGKEHMTSTTTSKLTLKNKPVDAVTVYDIRWKNARCSADDLNLRNKGGK